MVKLNEKRFDHSDIVYVFHNFLFPYFINHCRDHTFIIFVNKRQMRSNGILSLSLHLPRVRY